MDNLDAEQLEKTKKDLSECSGYIFISKHKTTNKVMLSMDGLTGEEVIYALTSALDTIKQ